MTGTFFDIDGEEWTVEIIGHREGHTFVLGDGPIQITCDPVDNELAPYAISKKLSLRLVSQGILEHIALAELTNAVEVRRNGTVMFSGELVPYDYQEEITSPDYIVELTAVCKLTAMLQDNLPYSDNTEIFTPLIPFLDTTEYVVLSQPDSLGGSLDLTDIEVRPRWLRGTSYKEYFQATSVLFGGVWYERQGQIVFQFLNQTDFGLNIPDFLAGATIACEANYKTLEVTFERAKEHVLIRQPISYSGVDNATPNRVFNGSSLEYKNSDVVLTYDPGKLYIIGQNNVGWDIPAASERLVEDDINKADNPYWNGISALDPRGWVIEIIIRATKDDASQVSWSTANGGEWVSSSNKILHFLDEPLTIELDRLPDYDGLVEYLVSFEIFPLYFIGVINTYWYAFAYTCEGGSFVLKAGEAISTTQEYALAPNGKGTRDALVTFNNYDANGDGQNIRVGNDLVQGYNTPLIFDNYGLPRLREILSNSIRYVDGSFILPANFWVSNWPAATLRYDYGDGVKAFRMETVTLDAEMGEGNGRLREVYNIEN